MLAQPMSQPTFLAASYAGSSAEAPVTHLGMPTCVASSTTEWLCDMAVRAQYARDTVPIESNQSTCL